MTHTFLPVITVSFPEVSLRVRDAHKLRGYIGNLFREHSPLLHNHFEDGSSRYEYPKVQYKVLRNVPYLVGIGDEASRLMGELFMQLKELDIDGQKIPLLNKNIDANVYKIGLTEQLNFYRFETLWMALNQDNHRKYMSYEPAQQADQLRGIATQHILKMLDACGLRLQPDERLMVALQRVRPTETMFKNQRMLAFGAEIVVNAELPNLVGIGKSAARGFGTLRKL